MAAPATALDIICLEFRTKFSVYQPTASIRCETATSLSQLQTQLRISKTVFVQFFIPYSDMKNPLDMSTWDLICLKIPDNDELLCSPPTRTSPNITEKRRVGCWWDGWVECSAVSRSSAGTPVSGVILFCQHSAVTPMVGRSRGGHCAFKYIC